MDDCTTLKETEHGLRREMIAHEALRVLMRLDEAGYKAYLCGGGVRDLLEDRRTVRLTFPGLDPDRVAPMLDALGREFNLAPEIDHPMRSLETFFLESVDRARRSQPEPSGVAAAAGVAPFLAGKGGAREDVLSKLVASPSQPAASPPPDAPTPETGAEKDAEARRAANEALRRLVK